MGPLLKRTREDRGAAIVEVALTMPLLLLVVVGIFEFGRAYQTWQVVTNAAREGARVAVLPNAVADAASTRVMAYLEPGQITSPSSASVAVTTEAIDIGGGRTAP